MYPRNTPAKRVHPQVPLIWRVPMLVPARRTAVKSVLIKVKSETFSYLYHRQYAARGATAFRPNRRLGPLKNGTRSGCRFEVK